MLIDDVASEISERSTRTMDKDVLLSQFLFWTSIEFNRYSLRKDVKGKVDIVNYFSMVFMKSGLGKGYGIARTKSYFDFSNYAEQMKIVYGHIREGYEDVDDQDSDIRYMPTNETITIEGTSAGLYNAARSVHSSEFGSVNVFVDEFIDHVSSSAQTVNKLKEAYDGKFVGRTIVGNKDDEPMKDIDNLPTNFIGMASLDNANKETMKILERVSKGGLHRRSVIVVNDEHPSINENVIDDDDTLLQDKLSKNFMKQRAEFNERLDDYGRLGTLIYYYPSDEYVRTESAMELDRWLIARANNDKLNQELLWDTGSAEVIINIAYLIAFIDGIEVSKDHIEWARDFFVRTRETIGNAMRERRDYEEITFLLNNKSGLTHADMLHLDRYDCIPQASTKFKDAMKVVRETAYRTGKSLTVTHGSVERYSIVEQESTNLKKLILSFDNDGCKDERKAIAFSEEYLPWSEIERLATSERVRSFTTCHYEPSNKTEPDGHRRAENYIEECNVIAFDIDDGMTIEEATANLDGYVYIIYTTKSHTEKENRFRVIMPVLKKFELTSEQYKDMMTNVADMLGLTLDTKARNVSRLFFTNKNAEIVLKTEPIDSDDPDISVRLLDISSCLPDTDSRKEFVQFISARREYAARLHGFSDSRTEEEEIRDRIDGFMRKAFETVSVGNLNDTLYRIGAFIMDLTKNIGYVEQEIVNLCKSKGIPMRFAEEAINRFR